MGIRQPTDSAGYESVVIAPFITDKIGSLSGKLTAPKGEIAVAYKKENGEICFTVNIPESTKAVFQFKGEEIPLNLGENKLKFLL